MSGLLGRSRVRCLLPCPPARAVRRRRTTTPSRTQPPDSNTAASTDATTEPRASPAEHADRPRPLRGERHRGDPTATGGMTKTVWWSFTGNGGPLTVSTRAALRLRHASSPCMTARARRRSCTSRRATTTSAPGEPRLGGRAHHRPATTVLRPGRRLRSLPSRRAARVTDNVARSTSYRAPPANDRREATPAARRARTPTSHTFGALSEPGARPLTCDATALLDKTVWYRYTAAGPGTATFDASGFALDARASTRGTRHRLGCTDDSGSSAAHARVAAGRRTSCRWAASATGADAEARHLQR